MTALFEAAFVASYFICLLQVSSPVTAKSNMKSLKQSLQPCFSITNIACCSHHRSYLNIDMVTFRNVFSESQKWKGSNKNEKSTNSSERVGFFQKSLQKGIHFLQRSKNQVFGIVRQVWVFSGNKKKVLGKAGKNVTLPPLLLTLQWLLTIFLVDKTSLAWHRKHLQFDNSSSFQTQLKNLRKLSGYHCPSKTV